MSSETTPISPARFAEALKDLPLSTLHLKAVELRNSIAHLDYSNEQLKPFADGTEGSSDPDQDCADAIKENEVVIQRMLDRIALLRQEVEERGSSWLEFQSRKEFEEKSGEGGRLANGTGGDVTTGSLDEGRNEAWSDGTFQTGSIVNGQVRMDDVDGSNIMNAANDTNATSSSVGGRLDDEALRRYVEERMRTLADEEDNDEGMHL